MIRDYCSENYSSMEAESPRYELQVFNQGRWETHSSWRSLKDAKEERAIVARSPRTRILSPSGKVIK